METKTTASDGFEETPSAQCGPLHRGSPRATCLGPRSRSGREPRRLEQGLPPGQAPAQGQEGAPGAEPGQGRVPWGDGPGPARGRVGSGAGAWPGPAGSLPPACPLRGDGQEVAGRGGAGPWGRAPRTPTRPAHRAGPEPGSGHEPARRGQRRLARLWPCGARADGGDSPRPGTPAPRRSRGRGSSPSTSREAATRTPRTSSAPPAVLLLRGGAGRPPGPGRCRSTYEPEHRPPGASSSAPRGRAPPPRPAPPGPGAAPPLAAGGRPCAANYSTRHAPRCPPNCMPGTAPTPPPALPRIRAPHCLKVRWAPPLCDHWPAV